MGKVFLLLKQNKIGKEIMKKTKILLVTAILGIATFVAIAADHIDAPAVAGGTSDITDYYAFQAEDNSNIAFVANVQGLLGPGSDTQNAAFDENVIVPVRYQYG